MDVSRRDFIRVSAGVGGTATLGGLAGLGADLAPTLAAAAELRIKDAKTYPSICPYCSVGCATLVHTLDGKIANIEGDPRSPHNEGTLCPKGAAIYQLHVNPNRPTQVLHRAPGAADWEVWDLERAMARVAELMKKTRDETFIERLPDGTLVNMTPAVFSLGGATLDNEWNHVIGLGIKRALLECAVADDPDPATFEGWLLARCLAAGGEAGATRAMALDVFAEWRLAASVPEFGAWLDQGAPSDDVMGGPEMAPQVHRAKGLRPVGLPGRRSSCPE